MKKPTAQTFLKNWVPALKREHQESFIRDVAALLKPPADDDMVSLSSTVSRSTGDPYVSVRMGAYEFQVAPEEARRIGRSFEDAASASELDAFVVKFFEKADLPKEGAWMLIAGLREYREKREQEEIRRYREQAEQKAKEALSLESLIAKREGIAEAEREGKNS